ncbi:MAG: capsid cement protein [Woeseiaceae bacterium]
MYKQEGKHVNHTFAAETAAGALVEIGTGKTAIVDANPEGRNWLTGETGAVTTRGVVEIANSGVVFAWGATVGYDATNDEAVAAAGGDFDCGPCVNAGGAAATDKVLVWIG